MMETAKLEIITPDETLCADIAQFRNKIHLSTGYLGTTTEELEKRFLSVHPNNNGYYIVVLLDGKIVGYSYGYKADEDRGKFDSLYIAKFGVDNSVKGKGISDEMMQWIYAKAKELGYKYVDLTVDVANKRAVGFYQRNGFVDHGSTYQEMRVGLESVSEQKNYRSLVPGLEGSDFFLLPEVKTPQDLMKWMDKNLEYKGECKGYLRTPEQLIKDKVGHCWETTELTRYKLKQLGYKCYVYYLENKGCSSTHTALVYKDSKSNTYNWFEWAWYKHVGIHSFKNLEDAVKAIEKAFKQSYKEAVCFTYSSVAKVFDKKDTEDTCIAKLRVWEEVHKPTPLFGYTRVITSEQNIDKFKSKYPNLSHVRTGDVYEGDLLLDGDKVVGFLQCNMETKFITALEINPEYRGLGLAKKLLQRAIKVYGNDKLTVRKTNTPAITLYRKNGWVVDKTEGIMIYMHYEKE